MRLTQVGGKALIQTGPTRATMSHNHRYCHCANLNRSALMHTVHHGHLDCTKLFMDYGADANHRALDG